MSTSQRSRGWRRDESSIVGYEGIPDALCDLIEVAGDAFVLDRQIRRGRAGEPDWSRNLHLELHVAQKATWQRADVLDSLTSILNWMTGDDWTFTISAELGAGDALQPPLPLDSPPDAVSLFSGGLDATAGTAQLLSHGLNVMGVGVVTNGLMGSYQKSVAQGLNRAFAARLDYRPVKLRRIESHDREEQSRRTRGFVFLSIGAAAAAAAGLTTLFMLENGVGAINLPYTAAQWGPMTSRAAHPRTLMLMEQLVGNLLDRPFKIENPHLHQTKGEMCALLPDVSRAACAASESCDYAVAGRRYLDKRCGECTSCILRRLSFAAAGRADWDPRPYRADIEGPRADRDRTPEMLWQVARLDRALASADPEALLSVFPALGDVPTTALDPVAQRRLFRAYVEEWRGYSGALADVYLMPANSEGSRREQ